MFQLSVQFSGGIGDEGQSSSNNSFGAERQRRGDNHKLCRRFNDLSVMNSRLQAGTNLSLVEGITELFMAHE